MPQYVPPLKKRPIRVTLNYEPLSDKHKAFHLAYSRDNVPVRILNGGVGTGKTIAVAGDICRALLTYPEFDGKTALVAGITGTHCRNLLVPEFKKILSWEDAKGRPRGLIENRDYRVVLHPMPEIEFFNGSKILFVSLESGVNLRGYNVSIVYADDIGETGGDTWDALSDRAFREKDGVGFIVATLNPTNPYHWAYKRYFDPSVKLNPRLVYVDTLTMFDNPALKSSWTRKEAQYAHSPVEYRRKILGEWCSQEGLVYTAFDAKTHVIPKADMLEAIRDGVSYSGHDFGGKDPTTALWVSKYKEKYYVYREYYNAASSQTISKHAEFINRQTEHVVKRYSDHYTESVNSYREHGVKLTLATKGNGAKLAGIELINQLFEDNRLIIADDCLNLIRELQQYEWLTNSARDMPKDGNDHCLTGDTLVETSSGTKRLDSIRTGELVLTANGPREVLSAGITQLDAPLYELKLSNGTIIKGTATHPFPLVDGRRVNLIDLKPGDELLCLSTGNNITKNNTKANKKNEESKTRILPQFVNSPKNGMEAKKVASGIKNITLTPLHYDNQGNAYVKSVPQNMRRQETEKTNFVPTDAGQIIVDNQALITSNESVCGAEPCSLSINIQKPHLVPVLVESITPLHRRENVYDLTVDGEHQFFANGILTYNCLDALRYVLYEIARSSNRIYSYSSLEQQQQQSSSVSLRTLSREPNIFEKHQAEAIALGAVLMGYEKDGKPIYARPNSSR